MAEISLNAAEVGVISVRLEPDGVLGRDIAGQPALYLPLKFQLLPVTSKVGGEFPYTLVRVTGKLQNPTLQEFGSFDLGCIALYPNPTPFYRQQEVTVLLDRHRVRKFEDAIGASNAYFQLAISALLWYQKKQEFALTTPTQTLDVQVPKSHWIENVISVWNLSNVKLVEIKFAGGAGENFCKSYAHVREAEKLFADGQYKQTLTSLRLSLEGLAKSFGFDSPGEQLFGSLFASCHSEKIKKGGEALKGLYGFLHLGPHALAAQGSHELTITRQDARFALTMAYAVLEYLTPGV
jgi:hypothetical protein